MPGVRWEWWVVTYLEKWGGGYNARPPTAPSITEPTVQSAFHNGCKPFYFQSHGG